MMRAKTDLKRAMHDLVGEFAFMVIHSTVMDALAMNWLIGKVENEDRAGLWW